MRRCSRKLHTVLFRSIKACLFTFQAELNLIAKEPDCIKTGREYKKEFSEQEMTYSGDHELLDRKKASFTLAKGSFLFVSEPS